ncbi:MAG: DEAD/DEAH box helicase, partial [Deltaproteobacteria bacterium]
MLDPIGAFERIRNYIFRYLDTAFRIDNPNVTKERHQLLQEEGTLSAEPQIEPIPKYKQAIYLQELLEEKYAHTLHNFSQEERQAFVELALAGLFPKKEKTLEAIYPIYTHQLQMLERGTKPGHPAIVTSGTGSGKTESFLLPIIATLSQEGKRKWSQCSPPQYKNNWWERDTFQFYREGEDTKRQAAVRVLLLYPMNALVEDQLARLREAIDSPEAHQVMDKHFNGHRIFIGRYTGKTPVTNFLDHPRPPDKWEQKRERKIEQLREAMNGFTRDRHEATLHDEQKVEDGEEDPKARYLFPSTKTGELCSRWDMQQYPPDILITNLSMLNGMLMREVENAILEKTRSWLQSNDDAYFFLVIDELHLQRGSAGTEVFYLLRLLLERLGLLEEEHRHKLRILSSSASLPTEGEGQTKSATYLWDAFGKLGSYPGRKEQAHFNQEEDWLQAIIPGEPIPFNPTCQETLPTLPFCALRELYYDSKAELALYSSQDDKEAWLQIAQAFNLPQKGDLASTVTLILEECGRRIYAECYDESNPTSLRATKLSTLAQRIFGGVDKEKLEALKGLLFIHGFADVYKHRFPRHSKPEGLPSFRVHTFFRALEGMFAPVGGNAYSVDKQTYKKYFSADAEKQSDVPLPTGTPSRNIGQLSIEPGAAIVEAIIEQTEHKSRQLNRFRQLPLLYCECCGELFIGGQRGEHQNGMLVEFLPSEVDLSKLPDSPVSPFFYTNSYKQAAIFWPTQIDLESLEEIVSDAEATNTGWVRAVFNPHAAVARILDFGEEASETGSWVSGYLFVRDENENDRHDRSNAKGGTALPYSCPRCASDYGNRPLTRQQTRLSPIRGFTTGLAMMTRLLASELYSILYRYSVHQAPKLISFSDSRQDAAKTAFNIASYHNSDAIRIAFIELLLNNQIDLQKKIRALPDLKEKMIALKKHKRSIEDSRDELEYEEGDSQQLAKLNSELRSVEEEQKKLKQEYDSIRNAQDNLISLEHIIEPSDEKLYHGQQELRIDLRPLTKRLIDLGINPANISSRNDLTININEPIDDEGREVNNQYDFGWHDIFNIVAGEVHDWKDDPNDESKQKRLDKARTKIAQGVRSHIGDALFRSNYFSLEAMGVGYPTLQGKLKSEHADMLGEFDALIRVMADRYWVDSGRWAKYSPGHQADLPFTGEDEILSTLQEAHRWSRRNRIRQYAEARWGENWQQELAQCIKVLWGDYGHKGGVVRMDALHLRLVTIKDRCWRCNNCKRIHLHVGSGICTRCFSTLPEEANESVRNIREDNYLTAQLERDGKPFRIRCEELTGQTDDPADRQKRFKDIIIGDYDDGHPKFRPRESIDMLAVTTTMEVGIDVGQLQAIFQANMPPTRFNYQQRVGRAGRRNQAFSFILTLCRSRSHDLHYFRHAEQITGSPPPPPFLTKTQPQIAKRLLHKGWLREVFERLKEPYTKSHQTYPADEMSPPDFHGEFLPKGFLTNRNSPLHPGQPWAELVKSTLQNSIGERDRLTSHLLQDSDLETETQSVATDPDDLYEEIVNIDRQSNAPGLAQNIAEYGLMPMYGMPTRVRNLYHGT